MATFVILLGGDLVATPRLAGQIAGARVIAADSGIAHARALDLLPELWIGDFDSASSADRSLFKAIPRAEFPPAKAKTDGELAVDAAIDRGATRLVLAGAFGGARADHAMLHLAMALALAERGLDVVLTSGDQEGLPLARACHPDWPDGTPFSVLALSDLAGLTIAGARWPLDAVDVAFGSSLTLSNVVDGKLALALGSGRAIAVARFGDKA